MIVVLYTTSRAPQSLPWDKNANTTSTPATKQDNWHNPTIIYVSITFINHYIFRRVWGCKTMVILFDQFNLPDDIFKVIFATEQQEVVGKLLINYIKENGGEIGKTEMSMFATQLHEGSLVDTTQPVGPAIKKPAPKISYNKRQFYDRILTPMKSMGMVDYDLYKKTYRISDKFNKLMIRIGLMWLREIR